MFVFNLKIGTFKYGLLKGLSGAFTQTDRQKTDYMLRVSNPVSRTSTILRNFKV